MMSIDFKDMRAIALDFIDDEHGFYFLRIVGVETVCNSIWAYLSRHDKTKSKQDSKVRVWPSWNSRDAEPVMTAKGETYRTLKTRLPSGAVDMCMIHPKLSAQEDTNEFLLLTYETGIPQNFFGRLNKALPIALKREWAPWLWRLGQRAHTWWALVEDQVYQDGGYVSQDKLTEVTRTPIIKFETWGPAKLYSVNCGGLDEEAWVHIMRRHLGLGRVMQPAPYLDQGTCYIQGNFTIYPGSNKGWSLRQGDNVVIEAAPSLNYLLVQARRNLGEHFIIK